MRAPANGFHHLLQRGLRLGAAQGLAVTADVPLIPVTSLEAMASQSGAERVLALLDARCASAEVERKDLSA